MAVTREQFERGMTYAAYKAQMTRNQDQFEQNEAGLVLSAADVEAFRALPRPLHVLALAEDWCGDVIANLPILGRIANESGALDVRVLLRDQNLDMMDQYLYRGQFRSIPVFIFLDDAFNERGVWIGPESVTRFRDEQRRAIYAQNPEFGSPDAAITDLPEDVRLRVTQAVADMRRASAPFANGEVVRELREIVERIAAEERSGAAR